MALRFSATSLFYAEVADLSASGFRDIILDVFPGAVLGAFGSNVTNLPAELTPSADLDKFIVEVEACQGRSCSTMPSTIAPSTVRICSRRS